MGIRQLLRQSSHRHTSSERQHHIHTHLFDETKSQTDTSSDRQHHTHTPPRTDIITHRHLFGQTTLHTDTSLDRQHHTQTPLWTDNTAHKHQKKKAPVGVISIFHMLQVGAIFLEASKLQQFPQQPLLQMNCQAFSADVEVLQPQDKPKSSTEIGQSMISNSHKTHNVHQ